MLGKMVFFFTIGILLAQPLYAEEMKSWSKYSPVAELIEEEVYYLSFIPENYEVVVAVVGTGINIELPHISDFIYTNEKEIAGNGIDDDGNGYVDDVHGFNFVIGDGSKDNNDVSDEDSEERGHETPIASLIASKKIEGKNYHGVCVTPGKIKIMPIKFERWTDVKNEIRALNYMVSMNVHVVNASYGTESGEVDEAYERLLAAGIVFVTAAGNQHSDAITYPNHYEGVITVGGLNYDKTIWWSSSYGENDFMSYAFYVTGVGKTGEMIEYLSGTSFAAPVVTAAIAKIMSYTGNYSREYAYNLLKKHAVDLGDSSAGHGYVNYQTLAEEFVTFHTIIIDHPENEAIKYELFYSKDKATGEVCRAVLRYVYVDGIKYSVHEEI